MGQQQQQQPKKKGAGGGGGRRMRVQHEVGGRTAAEKATGQHGLEANCRRNKASGYYSMIYLPRRYLMPLGGVRWMQTFKVLFPENPQLSNVPSWKSGVGQNSALRVSPAAKDFAFLTSASCSFTFIPIPPPQIYSDVCPDQ